MRRMSPFVAYCISGLIVGAPLAVGASTAIPDKPSSRIAGTRSGEKLPAEGCVPLEIGDSGLVKAEISKPGNYCLKEDLHARIEMADHLAEATLISIRANNVTLDLQGHTLGRGRIFKNPGGCGISIGDQTQGWRWKSFSRNIRIMNGVIRDFDVGVSYEYGRWDNAQDGPVFDKNNNVYFFPENGITLEDIEFKRNRRDVDIRVPGMPVKEPRRDKSQYPPCGGTDYFGRPLIEGQPCNDAQ